MRAQFAEYGCKKAEIDGYLERYAAESEAEELLAEQQELEFKMYGLACRLERVKPVRADFLNGEIPGVVIHQMEEWQNSAAGQ